MVRSCCILATDGRFQCAYPKCTKTYASQDAVRKHCRLQHLEWLRNLQTPSKSQQQAQRSTNTHIESPRLTALKCLPPSEALDLLQADDWLQDLMDFSGVGGLPPAAIPDAPPPLPIPQLTKEPSVDEKLDDEVIQQCIKSLNTAIRRCPSASQQAEMQKVVRLLSMKPQQIAQLGPRERKKVLTIRQSSIQKMQLANEIRDDKKEELAAEKAESEKGSEKGSEKSAVTGRSPALRPRGSSFDGKAPSDGGKGRMPPASFFPPPAKAQKTSDNGSSPDI